MLGPLFNILNGILGDFSFCVCYVEDILVFPSSKEKHLYHRCIVLDRLQQNGPAVLYDKCTSGTNEVSFLRFCITPKGVHPILEKVAAIQSFPTPSTLKALQEFLGMIIYHHCFLLAIAATLAPLYVSLKGKPKDLKWGPLQEDAFCDAKNAQSTAAESTLFVIRTDLISLVPAFTRHSGIWSAHQRRHLSTVAEYYCTLQHVPRKMNPIADALPRHIGRHSPWIGLQHLGRSPTKRSRLPHLSVGRTSLSMTLIPPSSVTSALRCIVHMHVEVVRSLPTSQEHCYLFTIIDRSTCWPEAIPMETATPTSCKSALLPRWIVISGIPDHITSNRGTTFTSQLWTSLANLLGITLHLATASNTPASGMVECFHRTLKADL
ncbi:uncharacterized protein [Palaemon carinicauda]|uniref:uncharacterized protein n=1 Tax=Palaemon carinicauda TaxID=392227 RepID=UPI0035B62CAD